MLEIEKEKNNENKTIPYFVHENEIYRMERHNKRLFIALLVAIILLFATNGAWLFYESMFDTISYSQDGEGLNNINTGTQGDISTDGPKVEDKNQKG